MPDLNELTYYPPTDRLTPLPEKPARVLIIGTPRSGVRNAFVMDAINARFEERGVIVEYDFDACCATSKSAIQPFIAFDEAATFHADAFERLERCAMLGRYDSLTIHKDANELMPLHLTRPKNKPWYGRFDKKRYG